MIMKKPRLKKILIATGILFLGIQLFRIDKNNPAVEPSKDFVIVSNAPAEITSILKASCYDCHSNEVVYPWYTNIAPFSWWMKHHVNEGREELNFSEWGTYSSRRMDHKLKECIEQIEENEMPLDSYLWIHSNAKLNADQKEKLIQWLNSLRTHESDKPRKL
jgi:hypothetical protein